MRHEKADALLVFRPSSIEYLCGYHTKETAAQPLLVTESDTFLYVPDLEIGRALASSRAGTVLYCGYADALRGLELATEHLTTVLPRHARVAVEFGHSSTPPQAVELLRAAGLELVGGNNLVERIRLVLSPAEIRRVEQAAARTEHGVRAAVAEAAKPGATDSSLAGAIAAELFRDANSPSAWGPTVATGNRGGIPHSSWTLTPLADVTFTEFAGTDHRYHAPVMRTLSRGSPAPTARRLGALSRTAVGAVLDTARDGVPCADVAGHALRALGRLDSDIVFHHVFGYPVGLAHPPHWMDGAPFYITTDNPEPLRAGMVFHIPSSFRSFGTAGVGFSHTFVVEKTAARVLTHGTADFLEI